MFSINESFVFASLWIHSIVVTSCKGSCTDSKDHHLTETEHFSFIDSITNFDSNRSVLWYTSSGPFLCNPFNSSRSTSIRISPIAFICKPSVGMNSSTLKFVGSVITISCISHYFNILNFTTRVQNFVSTTIFTSVSPTNFIIIKECLSFLEVKLEVFSWFASVCGNWINV